MIAVRGLHGKVSNMSVMRIAVLCSPLTFVKRV